MTCSYREEIDLIRGGLAGGAVKEKRKGWVSLVAFFSLLLLFVQTSQADLLLEVTQGNDKLTSVAISPFGWHGEELLPQDMASIIDNDLQLSGLFEPLPRKFMLSFPSQPSEVYYRDWEVLGASYLVTGQVKKVNNSFVVDYQLFDIIKKVVLLNATIEGNNDQLRALAHYISDSVYEKITGFKGDFSSRLLYVIADMVKPAREELIDGKLVAVPPAYDYQLKYADADGQRAQTVFRSKEPILSPSWSPDGLSVAYVSFESGRSQIFMQNLKTGKRESLGNFKGVNSSPAWSPDGKKMAFSLSKGRQPDIYIIDLKTKVLSRVTSHFSIDTEPDWMPDGKSIIFTSSRGGSVQVYQLPLVMQSKGRVKPSGKPKRLTFTGRFNARAKVFPNGKLIAMVHKGNADTEFNIAVQNLSNGSVRLLTSSRLEDSPSIAPAGQRLIYSVQGEPYSKLGIVSADGRVKYSLPSTSGDVREPAWGPGVKFSN